MSDKDVALDAAVVAIAVMIAGFVTPDVGFIQFGGYAVAAAMITMSLLSWFDDMIRSMSHLNANISAMNDRLNSIKRKLSR